MKILSTRNIWIIAEMFVFTAAFLESKQIYNVPPVPGLPPNTDPTPSTTRGTTEMPGPPMLSNNYLPAVMQALAYYVDLLQYETVQMTTIEPPFTLMPITTTTTKPSLFANNPSTGGIPAVIQPRPTPTPAYEQTTIIHRPGYYAPVAPPPSHGHSDARPMEKPISHNVGSSVEKPQFGDLPLLSISHMDFFNWFLQMKYKSQLDLSEYDLQILDPLPSKLLLDILNERPYPPSLLDQDNVNEFRRIYDDSFARKQPVTGKKRVPPTRPYVQMLMLYDLLKREAKRMKLHTFAGYTPEMIEELNKTAVGSAERQLYTLLYRMLDRKDVDKPDVNVRVRSIMDDLGNPNSVTSMSLRYMPPLTFVP